MITSYQVGAIFEIVDRASPVLEKLAGIMRGVDAEVKKVIGGLERLGNFALSPKLAESVNAVAGAFGRIDKASEATRKELTRFGDTPFATKGILGSVDEIANSFRGLPAIAEAAKKEMGLALSGFTAEAQREIGALKLEMANIGRASLGQGAIAGAAVAATGGAGGGASTRHAGGRGHGGSGGRVGAYVPTGVHGLHMSGHGGGLVPAIVAGAGIYEMVRKAMDLEALKVQADLQGVNAWWRGGPGVKNIYDSAVRNSNAIPTASITGSFEDILEIKKGVGRWDLAQSLLPDFTTAKAIAGASARRHGHTFDEGDQSVQFARGLAELGILQPRKGESRKDVETRVKSYISDYERTFVSAKGLFQPRDLFMMTNTSAGTSENWTQRMATVYAPIMSEIAKASKFGNMDYMLTKSYQSGKITPDAVEALMKYGLALPGRDTWEDKKHNWHLKPNSEFARGIETDIVDWSARKRAILKARGYNIDDQHVMNAFVNETGSNKSTTFIGRLLFEPNTRKQIEQDIRNRDNVVKDAPERLIKNDPFVKWAALVARVQDLFTLLGSGPILDGAIKALTGITNAIGALNKFFGAHPDAANWASTIIGVAGSLVILSAAVKMLGLSTGVGALFGGGAAPVVPGGSPAGKPSLWSLFLPAWIYGAGREAINMLPQAPAYPKGYDPKAELQKFDIMPIIGGALAKAVEALKKPTDTRGAFRDDYSPISFKGAEGSLTSMLSTSAQKGIPQGIAIAQTPIAGAINSATQQGVLDGLIAVSPSAQTVIASWFRAALGGILGGGGAGGGGSGSLISNASYSPGGGGGLPMAGGGLPTNAAGIPITGGLKAITEASLPARARGGFLQRFPYAMFGNGTVPFSLPGGGGSSVVANLPPAAKALLDTISGTESPGYDVRYGGAHFSSFADHPRLGQRILRGPNAGRSSDAAGRYQFISTTWDRIARSLGLKDFSPANQDQGAWALAQQVYGPSLLADLQSGDPAKIAAVGRRLAGTWTSLPGGIEAGTNASRFVSAFQRNQQKAGGYADIPFNSNITGLPARSSEGGSKFSPGKIVNGRLSDPTSPYDGWTKDDFAGRTVAGAPPRAVAGASTGQVWAMMRKMIEKVDKLHDAVHAVKDRPQEVHLDGKKVGQMVASHVTKEQTRMAWAPRQAPHHNSGMYPTAPDQNHSFA